MSSVKWVVILAAGRDRMSEEKQGMRLQKYMALCGVASRRHAEEMIEQGLVQVNGQTVREMGILVSEDDRVAVRGQEIRPEEEKHYILYYKPVGEVCTVSDPEGRKTVLDAFRGFPCRLYPVGRLDYDSEGLLILTNDGDLAAYLTHPSHEVEKSYIARVSLSLSDEEIRRLCQGVWVDGRRTAPAKVRVLRRDAFSTDILITIHEGRNRQIRKMVESVGHQVVRLKRVRYGSIELGDMERGTFRELTKDEVESLKRHG